MHISKINNFGAKNKAFKGYQHEISNAGEDTLRFNLPFDTKNKKCHIEIYEVVPDKTKVGGYRVIEDKPILTKEIAGNGTVINIAQETNIAEEKPFAYRFILDGHPFADNGLRYVKHDKDGHATKTDFTIVPRKGTYPTSQGAGILTMADLHKPGAYYYPFGHEKFGKIGFDKEIQKQAENIVKTYSNKLGGSLAGIEMDIPELKKRGVSVLFATPIVGSDNVTAHHYHNKNNMQISDDMGNIDNVRSFARTLFKYGIKFVNDGTLTSEGLEGIHVQHALRWADKDSQFLKWTRMDGLKNRALTFGVVPGKVENLRHRVINAPVVYNVEKKKVVRNDNYNPNKETYFQIYDATQVSKEQEAQLDTYISDYKKAMGGNSLDINSYDDTVINYILEVEPKDYERSLEEFASINRKSDKQIAQNSPDGTLLIARFPYFSLEVNSSGMVEWDSNKGLLGLNYHIAGYDEKNNQAYVEESERVLEQEKQRQGAIEVQDLGTQIGRYWTRLFRDEQTLYTAQTLKKIDTSEGIKKLIEAELLPTETYLDEEAITNIKWGLYAPLESKGILDRDDATIKALMKLPLDSLEFGENTAGVLSTSYFSNRATEEEQIGKTRFELMKEGNPHLLDKYANNYLKMNSIFENELKNFADEVIKNIDAQSTEKLLDEDGEYTEYGEYVIDLFGPHIAKYALLKSLAGEKLQSQIMENGEIRYNYIDLRKNTTLKSLGIKTTSPKEEATALRKLIQKGLDKLTENDIKKLSDAISKQIEGTNANSFKLADMMVLKAGKGLDWRADAAKDVTHMDSTRNTDTAFDQNWQNGIDFWARFVAAVKAENPQSYLVAEITDVEKLMKRIVGEKAELHDKVNPGMEKFVFKNVQDAIIQFFNQTGMTSEAAYSYAFTDLLMTFAANNENGARNSNDDRATKFLGSLRGLLESRSADYIRNLYTFSDNHDKPSIIHGMALDMSLFHGKTSIFNNGKVDYNANRWVREATLKAYTNNDSWDTLPLELKLNMDNPAYFANLSPRAVSMHTVMREAINESLGDLVNEKQKALLKEALVDLTNGNFMGVGSNAKLTIIKTKALSCFEEALTEILANAKIDLTKEEFNAVIQKAYSRELIDKHSVRGDFNWNNKETQADSAGSTYGQINRNKAEWILKGADQTKPSGETNYMKYSPYTLSFTAILAEAFESVKADKKNQFLAGASDFLKKYDRKTVQAESDKFSPIKTPTEAMRSNGFAARDFETVIKMIIDQANYRHSQQENAEPEAKIQNKNDILKTLFKYTTEPAIQKAVMYAAYLSGYPGICVTFIRDMLGAMGYEEKTKNLYLQDRNAVVWSQLEEGPLKEYRNEILNRFTEALQVRSKEGSEPINNGTPYIISTSHGQVPAIMFQDGYGDVAISVFNSTGINTSHKHNYFDDLGITDEESRKAIFKNEDIDSINPHNKFVPIQRMLHLDYIKLDGYSLPLDTEFRNIDLRDQATYVVKQLADGAYAIVNSSGSIALNGTTAKNGVLQLVQKARKKPIFRGRQYNIVSNPYQVKEKAVEGENLSILAK